MGAFLTWKATAKSKAGFLAFDVVTAETLVKSSKATEHAVERGADVADHVREELDRVTLDVFVSNSPIQGGNHVDPNAKRGDMEGITLDIPRYRPPLRFLSLSALLSAAAAKLFPSVTPPVRALLLQFSEEFDAVQETIAVLERLRGERTLIDITSPHWYAESLILERFTVPRTQQTGDGAALTLEFKQLRIVETLRTTAPIAAMPRAKGIAKIGSVGATEVKPTTKSVLLGALGGPLGL